MSYCDADAIELRYPGELAQAGPRDSAGNQDDDAIAAACADASDTIDLYLRTAGWPVPVSGTVPDVITDLAIDIALYLATPTVLASQTDFADRKNRYDAALRKLEGIARGDLLLDRPVTTGLTTIYSRSKPRVFGRGTL